MNARPFTIVVSSFALLSLTSPANAGIPANSRDQAKLAKTTTNDVARPLLINNIFNYYSNNGDGCYNKFSTNNEGIEFYKGSGQTLVFEDGIVWACYKQGALRVGGSVYRHALQAGPIIANGTASTKAVADDPASPSNRVYRVRRDMSPLGNASAQLALLQSDEVPLTGRYEPTTAATLQQQYWDDWNTWPAAQGAPYTDVDHNGIYDPMIDIPGMPQADQTIWYVANDMDSLRVANLTGSTSIGLEMQKTMWAYRTPGALGNTIFMRMRLLNKSGVQLDSVRLGQFADPDVGDAGDDAVGCDTLLNLGYAYNGGSVDATYGVSVPAVGYDLLQGPIVPGSPGDSAVFGSHVLHGFRNLPMTSFAFFSGGSAAFADPPQGPGGDIAWNHLLHATTWSGAPFIDPVLNQPAKFCFPGDPVKATDGSSGWVYGLSPPTPQDIRLVVNTGPFTMAAGDTQEIVVATMAGKGSDRLSSITQLKSIAQSVQQFYKGMYQQFAPQMTYTLSHLPGQATIAFRADGRNLNIDGVAINLKTYGDTIVANVILADDGLHGDGAAGDKIFGGSVQLAQRTDGLNAEAVVSYHNGNVLSWPHVIDNIATANIFVTAHPIVSDNLNGDGIANPGENVRYVISLANNSPLTVSKLSIIETPTAAHYQLTLAQLGGSATNTWVYSPADPSSYLDFDVPSSYADSTYTIVLTTSDKSNNVWRDTLVFPVKPLGSKPYHTPLSSMNGGAVGNFDIVIVDSAVVKNHLYVIRGADIPGGGYSVKDSTTGAMLLSNHPLPDALGHTSPIVDGFKVLLGTVNAMVGMKSWSTPSGTRRFSPVGGFAGLGLEGFGFTADPLSYDQAAGTIGMAGHFAYGGIGTTLSTFDYHSVLLKLAAVDNTALWDPRAVPADTNYSRGYRYLRASTSAAADPSFAPWIINKVPGYSYQDYNYSVPFSAWDMDVNPPVRLAVGMMENNAVGGKVDGRYWPGITTGDNSIARELAFIFKSPYTAAPDTAFEVNMQANWSTPLMWVMTCARRAETAWVNGDQFGIEAYQAITTADFWTFNPSVVLGVAASTQPTEFALNQNYPNPFNPTTVVSWQLSVVSNVQLRVFDVLGREVATLVNGRMEAGAHSVTFNARNIASGVYFCRLEATGGGKSYVATKKMMVLK
jgi:hypothetical protein